MNEPLPMSLSAYRLSTQLSGPFGGWMLKRRAKIGKEDPERLKERFGWASAPRPKGPLAWLHAASVGESLMLLPLVERLGSEREDLTVLVTTGTTTSAALMAQRLPARAIHQYVPLDKVAAVRRFIKYWSPDLAIFAESELWPNLIVETERSGARLALVNARMSDGSIRRWGKAKRSAQFLLDKFEAIFAADVATANGLSLLTGRHIASSGNLKCSAPPPPIKRTDLEAVRGAIDEREMWLAASTHEGEEAFVLSAHKRLLACRDNALLALAPRHPERAKAIVQAAEAEGFKVARRSQGELPTAEHQVYLADTLGELGLFFILARAAFVGGSLVKDIGGHNPIEPARLGRPIITGPYVANFADIYLSLMARGAARRAETPVELADEIERLMSDAAHRSAMARAAGDIAAASGATLDATFNALIDMLPPRHADA